MTDGDPGEPDASSIKPVSSLRSQFESLTASAPLTSKPKPPPPVKPPTLKPSARLDPPPSAPASRRSLEIIPSTSRQLATSFNRETSRSPTPGARRPAPDPPKPRSRPTSMILSPSPRRTPRPSPPRVNVHSPKSPLKVNLLPNTSPTRDGPLSPALPRSATAHGQFVSPSRPLPRRGESALSSLQALKLPSPHHRQDQSSLSNSDSESRGRTGPPIINRSAKPRVGGELVREKAFASAPGSGMSSRERRVSPFNTPLSSDEDSPAQSPEESDSLPPLSNRSKPTLLLANADSARVSALGPTDRTVATKRREQDIPARSSSLSGLVSLQAAAEEQPPPALPPRRAMNLSQSLASTSANSSDPVSRPSALMLGFSAKPSSTNAAALTTRQTLPAAPIQLQWKQRSPGRPAVERQLTTEPRQARNVILGADHADRKAVSVQPFTDLSEYPDSSQANRRPPFFPDAPRVINVGHDNRHFDVCGEAVCVAGTITRVYNLLSGRLMLSMAHQEHVRVTALCFKPTRNIEEDGLRILLGTNWGEIMEVDIANKRVVASNDTAHGRREIVKMYRHGLEVWSLDEEGKIFVWPADSETVPSLSSGVANGRVARRPTASVVVGDELWLAFGKEIWIVNPTSRTETSGQQSSPQRDMITTSNDITCGTTIADQPDKVYFGRTDGKIAIFSRSKCTCLEVVNVSLYRINCLVGIGSYLWTGHGTGIIIVHDTTSHPWRVKKDWSAHETTVASIVNERDSLWKLGQLPVVSFGSSTMHVWDGLLQDDWIDDDMHANEDEYCNFSPLTSLVLTWNVGATKPGELRYDEKDSNFFRELLEADEPPDILVFGLQELVDLEDKKLTAKTFFKSKHRDAYGQEHLGSVYRSWRDYFTYCLDDYMPANESYVLAHSASLVGLFSCVFVKASHRARIRDVQASEVKTGMGGLHGNKGAIVIRVICDDSSLCFVNCHLAAGQTQTANRNNDIASILETSPLPSERTASYQSELFVGGGDGSMILDCETCILNGDLNYRIDTMTRDTIVSAVKQGDLSKLLERDQLILSRRKNPGFRLRSFQEGQITFAPTYKYDVGTDTYDTSDKRRAPAWCDRILYRGRVKQLEYGRHEVRVSDHRPVSGRFQLLVKTIRQDKRAECLKSSEQKFETRRKRVSDEAKLQYLNQAFGLGPEEARKLLDG